MMQVVNELREQPAWKPVSLPPEPLEDHIGISNSEIATWKRCRRKWFLHYYLGYQADGAAITSNVMQGSRGHIALQGYYGHGLDPMVTSRAIYQYEAEQHPAAVADLQKEFDMTVSVLDGYAEWLAETGADRGLVPVAAEQAAWYPLPDLWWTPVYLRMRLDVVVFNQHTGKYLFIDHKFVASFDAATLLLINEQMKMYVMLQRLLAAWQGGTPVDGGIFNMLKRSKRTARATPPFYKREPVTYNDADVLSMWRRTITSVGEIMAMRQRLGAWQTLSEEQRNELQQVLLPPSPMETCSWQCPFLVQCPMMDDGSRWEAALEGRFTRGDPYDYYANSLLETLMQEGRIGHG